MAVMFYRDFPDFLSVYCSEAVQVLIISSMKPLVNFDSSKVSQEEGTYIEDVSPLRKIQQRPLTRVSLIQKQNTVRSGGFLFLSSWE